ncbi:hypothetical protein H6B11_03905 [Mediterraneibacter glycyrrhizinilyticus]|nr:hypothetical protein [Mediterraneibacter glycyrrhizinilyticus]MBM6853311.1 hypothetical protein [Mediterraneibacter glycyrrhizinilyticus]
MAMSLVSVIVMGMLFLIKTAIVAAVVAAVGYFVIKKAVKDAIKETREADEKGRQRKETTL